MIRRPANLRSEQGFTLFEMTAVLTIIACLLVLLLPALFEKRPDWIPLEQEVRLMEQDIQTLRLMQYSKQDQALMQFRFRGDGTGYLVLADDRLLWQRTFQNGHTCTVPPSNRIIYFKSYHSIYAATWSCRSATAEYEIKFLLGNYQMAIRKVR
ncbi:prepilin-type N-terminal cleavage/methylation domain-containing protein [Exiguobacterium acetylicum]|uniref:prepilin-type N-terminal cleavage/methylation domain-containing protein n=1 Tax=Exiguobacterium acetylicum TaxID=41170 RepID=UPI00397787B9